METTKDIEVRQSSVDLWIGVLAPPLAYAANFQAKYALVGYVCRNHASWLLILVAAIALALCGWGAFCAKRGDAPMDPADRVTVRRHVMSMAGLLISIMFALAIVATVIPEVFLRPCD